MPSQYSTKEGLLIWVHAEDIAIQIHNYETMVSAHIRLIRKTLSVLRFGDYINDLNFKDYGLVFYYKRKFEVMD